MLYRHPSHVLTNFSRDNLSPLILVLAAIKIYVNDPNVIKLATAIIKYIASIDIIGNSMSNTDRGKFNWSIRWPISVVANAYEVDCHSAFECLFKASLYANELKWKYSLWDHEHYAIWNMLGQLSACHVLGKSTNLRKYFLVYAKQDWGVAYKIEAGKSYTELEILERYKDIRSDTV